ncbi:MAG TPA: tRNA (adenosine(37)-N6)-dimethylallyltransferase MiaA [Candidatus Saccharimonadia bacterium]|nr:tRNA (adenosine(37)-N6)-dimethylallyltransferase MiaA [Candidatus Saccharimonadia bacterium]
MKLLPLVFIVGETASGKSKLAIDLALKFNGEIINADSWAVYRGFDIGTAKPSVEERRLVPHHLFDVADPLAGYSAAIFKRMAGECIEDIYTRKKLPIIVGGTGLYIDSIIYNYIFLPGSNLKERSYLETLKLDDLKTMVNKYGFDSTGIDLNNKRRVIRLIENKGKRPQSSPMRKNILILGLKVDAANLENNIKKRVKRMLNDGLEREVKRLVNKYGWDIEPMKGIGYRQFKDYFNGHITYDQLRELIISDTIKLVKKQKTWFKRNKSIHWLHNSSQSVELITTFLNKSYI